MAIVIPLPLGGPSASVITGLHRWAAGAPADEAAVQLLATVDAGRLCDPAWPWVRPCRRSGWYALDASAMAGAAECSALLPIAAALVDDDPITAFDLAGLDRTERAAVLVALAHAGRCVPKIGRAA